jgi:hypothetical protein
MVQVSNNLKVSPFILSYIKRSYNLAMDGKKPKVIKNKRMEYFPDKKPFKGHFLDILV